MVVPLEANQPVTLQLVFVDLVMVTPTKELPLLALLPLLTVKPMDLASLVQRILNVVAWMVLLLV